MSLYLFMDLFPFSTLEASVLIFIILHANDFWLSVYYPAGGVLHTSSFSAPPVFSLGVGCSIATYYINSVR